MADSPVRPQDALPRVESDLLVATCMPTGEPIFRNAAWRAVLGATPDLWDGIVEEDRTRAAQSVSRATAGSLVTNHLCQAPARHEGDEPLPVLLNFLPVRLPDPGGEHLRVRAVTITGEVLTEPASWTPSQTQRHRMEALGRMTMGIAHDFNNLLSGLLGHAELLKRKVEENAPGTEFRESLETIEQAAVDGARLVEKIQRYIRQESQTHFEPVYLPELVQGCITLTRPYWYNEPRRQGIAIDLETRFEEVPPIAGAPTELREVFVNLILNAVQAMPEGGTLSFEIGFQAHRGVIVKVGDTGMGMSEAVRRRIFEPLFTTKSQDGTGMGLAVSYGIVQEHEGSIRVKSEPGRGTRFEMRFPPVEAEPATRPIDKDEVTSRPARILIVDDEQMVRSVLKKLLTLKGHTITQAASGAEALALVDEGAFDVVFTDHGMPAMNGRQLARALRGRFPDLPIVLLTGDTEVLGVKEVDVVLSKPFKLDTLERTIQSLL